MYMFIQHKGGYRQYHVSHNENVTHKEIYVLMRNITKLLRMREKLIGNFCFNTNLFFIKILHIFNIFVLFLVA